MTTSSRYLELRVVHGPSSPSVPTRSPTPTTRLLDVTPTFPSHPSLPTHPNSSIELSEPQASKRIQVLSKNFHSSIAHHHLFSSDTITRLSISQAHHSNHLTSFLLPSVTTTSLTFPSSSTWTLAHRIVARHDFMNHILHLSTRAISCTRPSGIILSARIGLHIFYFISS